MQKPSVSPAVFIVDDDDAVRDSLEALVDSAGLAVESFSSGTMFLKAVAAELPATGPTPGDPKRSPGVSAF